MIYLLIALFLICKIAAIFVVLIPLLFLKLFIFVTSFFFLTNDDKLC